MKNFSPIFFLLLSLAPSIGFAQPAATALPPLASLSLEALEALDLSEASEPALLLWLGSARERLQDTVLDLQLRGDIAYNLIADELQRRNEAVTDFDPESPVVQQLLVELAAQQYHLALTRPSDWEKLVHYAKDGRWDYIGQRFFDRNLHYPALGLSLLGGVVLWGRRRRRRKREATPLP